MGPIWTNLDAEFSIPAQYGNWTIMVIQLLFLFPHNLELTALSVEYTGGWRPMAGSIYFDSHRNYRDFLGTNNLKHALAKKR